MASLIQRGIIALANQGALLESARRELARAGKPEDAIAKLIAEQAPLEKSAKDVIEVDFHPINVHGIIGLWVTVEVAVEDTAVLILLRDSGASALVQGAGVKLPNPSSDPLDIARRIYRRLEQHARQGGRVAEGYCFLLSILRVAVSVPVEVADVLSELNYVRNCLLHRNGIADDRAAAEAPTLGLASGTQIKVPSSRYLRYFDAASQFARALYQGALSSPYVRTRT